MRERAILRQLDTLLPRFGAEAAASKRALLTALEHARLDRAADLLALQRAICFLRAFPDDARVHRAARRLARGFAARVARLPARERATLDDSGMAGTTTRDVYGCAPARWLATRFAAEVDIDWSSFEAPQALAPLLQPLLDPLEDEHTDFDGDGVRDWIARARAGRAASDLQWLLAQSARGGAGARTAALAFARAYDAAEVPLTWRIGERAAITGNALPGPVALRGDGMRRPAPDSRAAIMQPLQDIALLPRRAAARLLDVWRAALWSRTRTVFQIEQPNLDECWLCDLGRGLAMAAIGVQPGQRGTLEVTFGYLLLANGMPIGYGGFTPLFRQVNTGINVFPQYRGSEAAFAWQQALRAMRTLTGCDHFIVNPYQFGAGNDEALASGAFWFYYRLGFRPLQPAVWRLAEHEQARLRSDRAYRVPKSMLRELAACDLRLDLSDRGDTLFDEAWIAPLATGITAAIAREPAVDRATAIAQLTRRVAAQAGIDPAGWSASERAALAQFAPLLAQIDDLERWPATDKAALAALIRARRAPLERDFVARLREHDRLRTALARAAAPARRAADPLRSMPPPVPVAAGRGSGARR